MVSPKGQEAIDEQRRYGSAAAGQQRVDSRVSDDRAVARFRDGQLTAGVETQKAEDEQ